MSTTIVKHPGVAALALLALAAPAGGQEIAPPEAVTAAIDSGDTAWMLVSTLLVILMTIPGLALF